MLVLLLTESGFIMGQGSGRFLKKEKLDLISHLLSDGVKQKVMFCYKIYRFLVNLIQCRQ